MEGGEEEMVKESGSGRGRGSSKEADWEDQTCAACVGSAREERGGGLNFSFSDISNRCDASEGKLINLF